MGYVKIIGAKSDIAKAVARQYVSHGFDLYLLARNVGTLNEFAQDLRIRHNQKVELHEFDVLDYASHEQVYAALAEEPEGVVCAVGYLGDQETAQNNFEENQTIIETNYTGVTSILNIVANRFEKRGSGFIVGVSSVAGDRGRRKNYHYGAAKAALSAYLSGLRNRLYGSGVHVLTVKPGFVNTQMTTAMDLPKRLTAEPDAVARDIFNAQQRRRNTLYTASIWWLIMSIIRCIPEWQFKKMDI